MVALEQGRRELAELLQAGERLWQLPHVLYNEASVEQVLRNVLATD